jgi:hypothetical protein
VKLSVFTQEADSAAEVTPDEEEHAALAGGDWALLARRRWGPVLYRGAVHQEQLDPVGWPNNVERMQVGQEAQLVV